MVTESDAIAWHKAGFHVLGTAAYYRMIAPKDPVVAGVALACFRRANDTLPDAERLDMKRAVTARLELVDKALILIPSSAGGMLQVGRYCLLACDGALGPDPGVAEWEAQRNAEAATRFGRDILDPATVGSIASLVASITSGDEGSLALQALRQDSLQGVSPTGR